MTGPGLDKGNAREPLEFDGWHTFLEQFKREVYPLMSEYGLTYGEALILWELNNAVNILRDLRSSTES